MKRLLIAAATFSLLAGGTAMAQSRGEARHDYRGGGEVHREYGERGGSRGGYEGYRGGYGGYRGGYEGYRGGYGYRAPVYGYRGGYGYGYGGWRVGGYLPRAYFGPQYYVNDWSYYRLRRPPYGYRYVRVGGDIVLAAIAGGLIADVISGY